MTKDSSPPSKLLRIGQVAEALSVSDRTVRRLINDGELPSCKIRNLRLVFRDDLNRMLDRLRQEGAHHA